MGCLNDVKSWSVCWITVIIVEVTCQDYNGGCDQDCDETETGVNCSCYDGYQLIDNQNCTGKQATPLSYIAIDN